METTSTSLDRLLQVEDVGHVLAAAALELARRVVGLLVEQDRVFNRPLEHVVMVCRRFAGTAFAWPPRRFENSKLRHSNWSKMTPPGF